MSKKILVLGATGMLGHIVYYYLKENPDYKIHNIVRKNKLTKDSIVCDVKNRNKLENIISRIKPDYIINCIGALIKESQEDAETAIYLNSLLPHILKKICNKNNARLIHISTDCVFSGKKGNYAENDFRDADDIYGRSKALGEIFEEPHCTLRTSIIGPELKENGSGLFDWFMKQEGKVNGYVNVLWSGVTTLELAKVIYEAIKNRITGLYHVTNSEPISKYELLILIKTIFNKNIIIAKYINYKNNKNIKRSTTFNFRINNYYDMINNLKIYMTKHNEQYRKYLDNE